MMLLMSVLGVMMGEYWEVTDKVSDLIKQAEECIEYLEEDSVGYYFVSMLEALKQIDSSGNLVVPPKRRFNNCVHKRLVSVLPAFNSTDQKYNHICRDCGDKLLIEGKDND